MMIHLKTLLAALFLVPSLVFGQERYILKNVNVVDVVAGSVMEMTSVLIEGDKISLVQKDIKPVRGVQIIDLKGKYLIPGLWDMHTHIGFEDSFFFTLNIANGVTGIRDMGTRYRTDRIGAWQKEVNNRLFAPRVLAVAGRKINGPGGFGGYGFDVVSTEEEARASVRERHRTGATFIKVYEHLSPECYWAIVDEARKLNLPVAGHPPFAIGLQDFVRGGQKTIEHVNRLGLYCSREENALVRAFSDSIQNISAQYSSTLHKRIWSTFDTLKLRQVADTLARHNVWICPTVVLDYAFLFDPKTKTEKEAELDSYNMPVELQQKYVKANVVFEEEQNDLESFQRQLYVVKVLQQRGVKLLAGTDAPSMDFYSVFHGYSLHKELKLYVDAGISPAEALRTATINPAVFLGQQKVFGTIEKGKAADLVVLHGNPLQDINNTRNIAAVILKGVYYDQPKLKKLASDVSDKAPKPIPVR